MGDRLPPIRHSAFICYLAATLVLAVGVVVAFSRYPGGYDWVYTVVSRLASPTRNPDGGHWVTGSLLLAVLLFWPATYHLARAHTAGGRRPRLPITALRVGLAGAALLAVEGLLGLDFSRPFRKGHEALAIVTFLGFYGGVLGLFFHRARYGTGSVMGGLVVILPLVAVGLSQTALYFDQRDLGWVNTEWRELGVPFWLSFAFWQWLAVLFLGLGLGYLVLKSGPTSEASSEALPARRS